MLAPLVDYLTVNISSPNTPGLRDLQRKSTVTRLIGRLMDARAKAGLRNPPPLLLKIAPDLSQEERVDLAEAALRSGIDGLIVSNTTVARPASLASPVAHEPGGLSGAPLFEASTALLAEMYRLTSGKLPIVGVGGIASGADAYKKIRAGAALVQLYSALVFHGPGLVQRIKQELARVARARRLHLDRRRGRCRCSSAVDDTAWSLTWGPLKYRCSPASAGSSTITTA